MSLDQMNIDEEADEGSDKENSRPVSPHSRRQRDVANEKLVAFYQNPAGIMSARTDGKRHPRDFLMVKLDDSVRVLD